jgi:hypothetical protein
MMKVCNAHLVSATAYSQSKVPFVDKLDKESADAFEKRVWREKCHADSNGQVYVPAMAFKQCVDRAAAVLGMQIAGRGKATYTKHFLAGCIVEDNVLLFDGKSPIWKKDLQPESIHANADGKRGSGKRVWRTFPTIQNWRAIARFVIFDDTITKPIFEKHLTEAGLYVGIGRFRPENGGLYGRFKVERFEWEEVATPKAKAA